MEQARRDDQIRIELAHEHHTLAFGLWQDSRGVVKSCGKNVPDQEATVLKLLQTLNGSSSHATPEPFSAPEDAFWGGKLQRKQLIQLCRLLNHPSLKQVLPALLSKS